ncbi:MAG: TIM barrel protein [Clostridiaceae bacterium]|jgi:deoxyribonuclease IV|nr:TIM barrel protein [Clostridiaceae bacterium]
MKKVDKLNFLTAGMPLRTGKSSYEKAFEIIKDMNLDGMEMEFVHGVRMTDETRQLVKEKAKDLILTAHAPFYINLNSKEEEKVDASVERIIETIKAAQDTNAYSITFHAAFYLGMEKEHVYENVKRQIKKICDVADNEKFNVWIRPETTGKASQWGDVDEVIKLSNDFEKVLPCIDFSHVHARSGGEYNTYDEFSTILEKIGKGIGQYALDNFHMHLAGIDYSKKGEKHHLNLEESDMNYKDLLKALKAFDVKGALTCESPNIEEDTKLLKEYYLSL